LFESYFVSQVFFLEGNIFSKVGNQILERSEKPEVYSIFHLKR
jgi:hypothetical protein